MTREVAGEELFGTDTEAVSIYRAVADALLSLEGVEVAVSKSQVAFRAKRGFAYAWAPGRYVRSDVPLVVSIALPRRLPSTRFKEVAHPSPSTWMHHVELRSAQEVDRELIGWLTEAYDEAR